MRNHCFQGLEDNNCRNETVECEAQAGRAPLELMDLIHTRVMDYRLLRLR